MAVGVKMTGAAGNYVSTPDFAVPSGTELEWVLRMKPDDLSGGNNATFAKENSFSAPAFDVAGNLRAVIWNGLTRVINPAGSYTAYNGLRKWWRFTYDQATGAWAFYIADDAETEPSSWGTAQDSGTIASGDVADNTANVQVGMYKTSGEGIPGDYYYANMKSDGIIIAEWSAPHTGTRYRDSTGKIWTLNGSAYSTVITA